MLGISHGYVINLARRPDRREAFLKRLPPGVPCKVFEAVDGKSLKASDVTEVELEKGRSWGRAVLGVFLSHIRIWKEFVADPAAQNAIVFEDDVLFASVDGVESEDAWVGVWNAKFVPILPADFDIIYLDRGPRRTPGDYDRVFPKNAQPKVERIRRCKNGQYSYIISTKGARAILESLAKRPAKQSVDDDVNGSRFDELALYWISPPLCSHPPLVTGYDTDIQGQRESITLPK